MKNFSKLLSTVVLIGFASTASAQLIDQKDVSINLDMQPVLQLDMTTPNQIEFVFDDVSGVEMEEIDIPKLHKGQIILKDTDKADMDQGAAALVQHY